MLGNHKLHGRIKRFWIFMFVTSVVAFVANSGVQVLLRGEVDLHGAISTSLTLGIVLSIVMASQVMHKVEEHDKR